jgi:hypothetical protein
LHVLPDFKIHLIDLMPFNYSNELNNYRRIFDEKIQYYL